MDSDWEKEEAKREKKLLEQELDRISSENASKLDDKEFMIEKVRKFGVLLSYASENLKDDKELALIATKSDGAALLFCSRRLQDDKEIVIAAVEEKGNIFRKCSPRMKDDEDVASVAIRNTPSALIYCSEKLKDCENLCILAVSQVGMLLEHCSHRIRDLEKIVLLAVEQDGESLKFASENLRNNKSVCIKAVQQNGLSLQFCSSSMKKDKGIVLEAVKQNGNALEYSHQEYRSSESVVLAAVSKNGLILRICNTRTGMRNNRKVILAAVIQNGRAIGYASNSLCGDEEIVKSAVSQDGNLLSYASEDLRKAKEIGLISVRKTGSALRFCGKELQDDFEVVIEAVRNDGGALYFASDQLKSNREIITEAVKNNGGAMFFANDEMMIRDEELIKIALDGNGFILDYMDDETKNNKKFVIDIVSKYGRVLEFVSNQLKNDEDVVITAVSNDRKALRYMGDELIRKLPHSDLFRLLKRYKGNIERSLDEYSGHHLDHDESIESSKWMNILFQKLLTDPKISSKSNFTKFECDQEFCNFERENLLILQKSLEKVRLKDLVIYRSLGRGAYGCTYLCRFHGSFRILVLKVFSNPHIVKQKRKELLEKDALDIPYHENVVSILSRFEEKKVDVRTFPDYESFWKNRVFGKKKFRTSGIYMKYHQGSLDHFVRERRNIKMGMESLEIVYILFGVLRGSYHLHQNMIVHRDLHIGNVFLEEAGRVWIGDFGCCLDLRFNPLGFKVKKNEEILSMYSYNNPVAEDLHWLAPEINNYDFQSNEPLDYEHTDAYSVGVIGSTLLEILSEREKNHRLYHSLINVLVQNLKKVEPKERIRYEDALEMLFSITLFIECDSEFQKSRNDVIVRKQSNRDHQQTKNERDIILERIFLDASSFNEVDSSQKENMEFIVDAVNMNGLVLQFLDEKYQDNFIVVNQSVQQNGAALFFASERLKNDIEITRNAVSNNGAAIMFSKIIKSSSSEEQLPLTLKKETNECIEYLLSLCSVKEGNKKEVRNKIKRIFSSNQEEEEEEEGEDEEDEKVWKEEEMSLVADEIVQEAVKQNGFVLEHVGERFRNKKEFVLKAVEQNGGALEFASKRQKENVYIVSRAIQNDRSAFKFIGEDILRKSELLKIVSKNDGYAEGSLEEFSRTIVKSFTNGLDKYQDPWTNIVFEVLKNPPKKRDFGRFQKPNIKSIESEKKKQQKEILELNKEMKSLKFSDFIPVRYLGKGVYGTAYLCRVKKGFGVFVFKMYNKDVLKSTGEMKKKSDELTERDSLYIPYHENVVSIVSHLEKVNINLNELNKHAPWPEKVFLKNPNVKPPKGKLVSGVVFQKFYRKTLFSYMIDRLENRKKFGVLEICYLLQGIIKGAKHLHDNQIVHRDLHPGNIFVDEEKGRVWIGDFGCALDLREYKDGKSKFMVHKDDRIMCSFKGGTNPEGFKVGGAEDYMPPEVETEDPDDDWINYSRYDIFSVGVLGNNVLNVMRNSEDDVGMYDMNTFHIRYFFEKLCMHDLNDRLSYQEAEIEIGKITTFCEANERKENE